MRLTRTLASHLFKQWSLGVNGAVLLSVHTASCIVTKPPPVVQHNSTTTPVVQQNSSIPQQTATRCSTKPSVQDNSTTKPSVQQNSTTTTPPQTASCRVLINPANEQLIGTALPYFPMAAPPPSKQLQTSSWGAASAGTEMFYPVQSVDGVLGLHGGAELREVCRRVPVRDGVELVGGGGNAVGGYGLARCPVGTAVSTPACGSAVREHHDAVVHTVPPLWPGCVGVSGTWTQREVCYGRVTSSLLIRRCGC